MSYRLDPAMPMSEAVRRVAFGELEIAHGALATPPERHSGVHNARKCLNAFARYCSWFDPACQNRSSPI